MSSTIVLGSHARRRAGVMAAIGSLLVLLMTGSLMPVAAADNPYLVKDINKSGGSNPAYLTAVGDELFFVADDGVHGPELWKSDGTAAGTQLVKDIDLLPDVWSDYGPRDLTAIGDLLYFSANDGVHGYEPWISDGTEAGTRMIKDIDASFGSDPREFTFFNGAVYFSARADLSDRELYRTDGTAAGTRLVVDLAPGSGGSYPDTFVVFKDRLYFLRHQNGQALFGVLYRTNGTAAGTRLVRDRHGRKIKARFPERASWDGKRRMWAIGDTLFFGPSRRELWSTNGTRASTRKIANIGTRTMVEIGGQAYFIWHDDKTGTLPYSNLWTSDGTASGTHYLTFVDGSGIAYSDDDSYLSSSGDQLAFVDYWQGLSVSDGTSAGTHGLGLAVSVGGYQHQMPALNGVFYFNGRASWDATSVMLWRSDGTPDGTYAVSPEYASGVLDNITPVGDSVYFVTRAGKGVELYRYLP
jgi:ELWxxDGT repeat protein